MVYHWVASCIGGYGCGHLGPEFVVKTILKCTSDLAFLVFNSMKTHYCESVCGK